MSKPFATIQLKNGLAYRRSLTNSFNSFVKMRPLKRNARGSTAVHLMGRGAGLIGPELKARGLDSFSRGDPPMAKGTTLPDWAHSEVMLWPVRQSFFPYAPAPQDIYHTSEWGRAATGSVV